MYSADVLWAFNLINYYRNDVSYRFETEDENIVEPYVEEGTVYLKGKNPGTTTIKIYEDATNETDGTYIGACSITVKELKVENLDYYLSDNETCVDGYSIQLEVYKDPYNAPEEIIVTSSDPNVVTVSSLDEDNFGEITPVGEGTATITITCGDITKTETITVYADEDEMYGW